MPSHGAAEISGGKASKIKLGQMLVADQVNDEHLKLYGKRAEDLLYGEETCPRCKTRIDEHGWCGCDTIGGD